MEHNNNSVSKLTIPEVEQSITALDATLTDEIPLKARQAAQRTSELTAAEFKIKVSDPIQAKCQETMDYVKQQVQIQSNFFNAKEFEENAARQCVAWQYEYNYKEQLLKPLQKKARQLMHDPLRRKHAFRFLLVCIAVGIADGSLAFYSFRRSYTLVMALVTSFAIGAAIAIAHIAYADWIKQAKSSIERWMKIVAVLSVAFVFFYFMANMRVEALNSVVNTTVIEPTTQTGNVYDRWAICIVSFTLFSVIFALSLRLWRSKQELQQEEEYKKLHSEIAQLEKQMGDLQVNIKALTEKVSHRKQDVRKLHDCMLFSFKRIRSIGLHACNAYKKIYAEFRASMPDFFAADVVLNLDESYTIFETEKNRLYEKE